MDEEVASDSPASDGVLGVGVSEVGLEPKVNELKARPAMREGESERMDESSRRAVSRATPVGSRRLGVGGRGTRSGRGAMDSPQPGEA